MNIYLRLVKYRMALLATEEDLHPMRASEEVARIGEIADRLATQAREAGDFETAVRLYELVEAAYEIAADRIAPEFAALASTVAAAGNYWGLKADLARVHVPRRPKRSVLFTMPHPTERLESSEQPSSLLRVVTRVQGKPTRARSRKSTQQATGLPLEPSHFVKAPSAINISSILAERESSKFSVYTIPLRVYAHQPLENEVAVFPNLGRIDVLSSGSLYAENIPLAHSIKLQTSGLSELSHWITSLGFGRLAELEEPLENVGMGCVMSARTPDNLLSIEHTLNLGGV